MIQWLWFRNLLSDTRRTFRRFPHVILCSLVCSVLLIAKDFTASADLAEKLIMIFSLGVPAYFGLALFDERYTMRRRTVYLLHGILAAGLAIYFFTLPQEMTGVTRYRYNFLMVMAHLAVSFSPFLVNREMTAFWQYNRILFVRFLTAALYSLTLFLGLVFANYAIEQLFALRFAENMPAYIWYALITVNTLIFLNGIPKRVELLEADHTYPRGLRIFAGSVLLPLVVVFMAILYVYSLKLLVIQEWPADLIILLILVLSVAGVLAYLLLWPLYGKEEYRWVSLYARGFFAVLLPLVALMGLSTLRQIITGIFTADLYILLMICIVLLILSLYFLFNKVRSLKLIPVTLFIAALAAGFGPLNAFDITRESQLKDIGTLIRNNKLGLNYKLNNVAGADSADKVKLYALFREITFMNGVEVLQPFLEDSLLLAIDKKKGLYEKQSMLFSELGFEEGQDKYPGYEYYFCERPELTSVSGFNYFLPLEFSRGSSGAEGSGDAILRWKIEDNGKALQVFSQTDTVQFTAIEINRQLAAGHPGSGIRLPEERMNFIAASGKLHVAVRINTISFTNHHELLIESVRGYIYLSFTE